MSLKVTNMSPGKVDMTNEGVFYTFDYGDIPFKSDSEIVVKLIDESGKIANLQVLPTCGCTVSSVNKNGNEYEAKITYDTSRKGRFHKQLHVPYKEGWSNKKIIINIKGTVA